jgi:hypothetical protein
LIGSGCILHGAEGVAVGVALFFIIQAPAYTYFALHRYGCTWREVFSLLAAPTMCASAASGLGLLTARLTFTHTKDAGIVVVVCAAGITTYLLLIRRFAPQTTAETLRRLAPLWDMPFTRRQTNTA